MTDEFPPKAHKSSLTAVAVSPCGAYAFTASKDGGLVKWAVGEEGAAASVRRVGRVCAAGGHGAREEDMAKGKSKKAKGSKKKKQTNYGPRINAVAVSSDGKFLVSIVVLSGNKESDKIANVGNFFRNRNLAETV